MGAYLSEPITKKISSDDCGKNVAFGASSMQGWRISQEDAHNCCINFDEDTSLFAVYDGHGGHEVATYCAKELPAFIKNTDAYKNGDIKQALIDAFLGFDAELVTPEIIKVLKEIAGTNNNIDNSRDKRESHCPQDEDEESVSDLRMDAAMPLEQVMARYSMWQKESKEMDSGRWQTGPSCSSSSYSWGTEQQGSSGSSQTCNTPKNDKETVEISCDISNGESSNGVPDTESSADPNRPEGVSGGSGRVSGSSGETLENGDAREYDRCASLSKVGNESCRQSRKIKHIMMEKSREIDEDEDDDDEDDDDEDDETFDGSPNASDDDTDDAGDGEEQDSSEDDPEGDDRTAEREEDEQEDDDDDDDDDDDEEEDDGDFTMDMTEEPGSDSGCTAVVAILHRQELYVANAGDSRCVLCRDGQALELSLDHKPEDEPEMERIVKAGGKVTADGRVNGGLNLSRALGDHAYKQNTTLPAQEQMISALPDVRHIAIEPERDEFMILACDGIWNFMTSQEVVTFIRPRLINNEQPNISKICEELFDHCLATDTLGDGTGCDNMTAVIVKFNRPNDSSAISSKKRPISPSNVTVTTCKNSTGKNETLEDTKKSEDTSKRPKTEVD